MITVVDKKQQKDCCGCRACEQACPVDAITMREDEKGFMYPDINMTQCIHCDLCDKVCGFDEDNPCLSSGDPVIFAAVHKNDAVRSASTSGGLFTALSDVILHQGGVIYGAAYGPELYVRHERAETADERERLRTSKYVQSDTCDTFSLVKSDLDNGRVVMYTGTPCQIASLQTFLRTPYENLITVDVVCHGVPSARVWREFLDLAEKKAGCRVVEANFRDKSKTGWHRPQTKLIYEDGLPHSFYGEQSFFQMFNHNLFLRPSCLYCKFISYARPSDISIADYWGIERFRKDFDDNGGVSMVLVNTDKGQRLFDAVKDSISYFETDKEHCWQGRLQGRSTIHPQTEQFWKEYTKKGLRYVLVKYTDYSPFRTFFRKVKRKIRRDILKKGDSHK